GASNCPGNGTPDVWYRIDGACAGLLNINTCGSSFDTILSVHTACPGTSANQVACNDDGFVNGCGIRDSPVVFMAAAGATYYVRVGSYSTIAGGFHLNSFYVTPGADNCATAPSVGNGTFTFTNCGATTDGPINENCATPYNDLWFSYTAPQCGT